jgi:hypothetical protein
MPQRPEVGGRMRQSGRALTRRRIDGLSHLTEADGSLDLSYRGGPRRWGPDGLSGRAIPPERKSFDVQDSTVYPAGEICDFDFELAADFSVAEATHFDKSGNPVRVFFTINGVFTVMNLETGASLTDVNHRANTLDLEGETQVTRGLYLQLRTPDGKLVAVLSGKLVFDLETGEITGTPPHRSGLPVICEALGGSPA